MFDCRLIIDPPLPGPDNMAVDEALLTDAAENGTATLRFYSWIEPTLSLGYFQKYADREQHIASRACAVVRRQTGGGAILHDRELTYSLTLPPAHPLTKQNEELYRIVHEVFVEIVSAKNTPSSSTGPLKIRGQGPKTPPGDEPFLCFQRRSPGDVIFVAADKSTSDAVSLQTCSLSPAYKILGSAQRRHHGAVLQHGSLLLERSPTAPEVVGWRDLVHTNVAVDDIISAAATRLGQSLDLRLLEAKLPPELKSLATRIANNKYGSPTWTKRR